MPIIFKPKPLTESLGDFDTFTPKIVLLKGFQASPSGEPVQTFQEPFKQPHVIRKIPHGERVSPYFLIIFQVIKDRDIIVWFFIACGSRAIILL